MPTLLTWKEFKGVLMTLIVVDMAQALDKRRCRELDGQSVSELLKISDGRNWVTDVQRKISQQYIITRDGATQDWEDVYHVCCHERSFSLFSTKSFLL